ncbi:MAG TPA: NADH-quinone oxidoreductase subunit NuoH [Candidatus Bathyarchaeia archaeon]|nr:NADH-quinone oxidoreductase subunit NuoH [Candidatus Bathyarchaeia archaeon]
MVVFPPTTPAELISLIVSIVTSHQFITIIIFPGFIHLTLVVIILTWYERKLLARMQLRIGPLYAGGPGGILQPLADGVKLIFKEVMIPYRADQPLFLGIPLILVVLAAVPFAVIPFGQHWVIANLDVGLVFVFAMTSLFPSMILIFAWASNSKYPFLGGLRSLFQQVAYEIPMWISTLSVVLMAGSLNLVDIVNAQEKIWFIIPAFLSFIVFFISIMAELERLPFDLPEAEPELVAGWYTESSGAIFMLIFMGLYMKLYLMSSLVTALFLGGWWGPAFLPQPVWFIIKTLIVTTFIIIPRGVYPRLRVDMLIKVGWNKLLIIAIGNIFVTVFLLKLGLLRAWGL